MDQGIAFARTLRALDADDFRGSKLGLAIAAILLGAWTWWMLGARIPQYERATSVRMENGEVIATFASTSSIHPGQSGFVGQVPARVQRVTADHAELILTNNQQLITPPASASVETSRVSPLSLALDAAGRVAK